VNAIQKIFSSLETVHLKEYRLEALTGGSNAVADVAVKVEDDSGNTASGRSIKSDIVVGSVEAIVSGINALLLKKEAKSEVSKLPAEKTPSTLEGI
jgi:2-isopropylmalate synthase